MDVLQEIYLSRMNKLVLEPALNGLNGLNGLGTESDQEQNLLLNSSMEPSLPILPKNKYKLHGAVPTLKQVQCTHMWKIKTVLEPFVGKFYPIGDP